MSKIFTLNEIESHIDCFGSVYDCIRIVDPEHKKVHTYHKNELKETDEVCFNCWQKQQICDNCISIRAYLEKKNLIKLEIDSDSITMITALPIENSDRPLVLELLKNVSDSLILDSRNGLDNSQILNTVYQLNDMVVKDHLTQVYNRYFIDERLPVNIINATLKNSPLSVIFIDVDNFKNINDTYGHGVGDIVLNKTADAISTCVRNTGDWVARYGGDEFLVCLSDTDADTAYVIAERIQASIANVSIPAGDKCFGITISVGIHTMVDQPLTAAEIIKLADQNMYKSKCNGKNCITSALSCNILDHM